LAKAGGLCGINHQAWPAFANTLPLGVIWRYHHTHYTEGRASKGDWESNSLQKGGHLPALTFDKLLLKINIAEGLAT
jgi:hypothetical protein